MSCSLLVSVNGVALVYPFFAENHLRRGRTVLRPIVLVSIGTVDLILDALVDSGSEHVLADESVAIAAGINLASPLDTEEIGLGGRIVEARFVAVKAYLHSPGNDPTSSPTSWDLEVGFISGWRPLYPCILGNVGFLDRFTVTISRYSQATAIEPMETFDDRFGL
jgi:hypothetical protein